MPLSLLVRLTAGHPSGSRWREAYRRDLWTRAQAMPLVNSRSSEFARRSLLMGEWPAMVSLVDEAGRAEPPPGWLPPDPRQRALILTGRPPPG